MPLWLLREREREWERIANRRDNFQSLASSDSIVIAPFRTDRPTRIVSGRLRLEKER